MSRCGFLVQAGGLWVGAHYSAFYRRWCINLLPCLTVWFTLKGGTPPQRAAAKKG